MQLFSLGKIAVPVPGTLVRVTEDRSLRATFVRIAVPQSNTGKTLLYIEHANAIARLLGTLFPPFTITAGVNDKLAIAIDGGVTQTVTLQPGTNLATETIAYDLRGKIDGANVFARRGQLVIESATVKTGRVNLQAVGTSCYATLGLVISDITATPYALYKEYVPGSATAAADVAVLVGSSTDTFIQLYQLLVDAAVANEGLLISGQRA